MAPVREQVDPFQLLSLAPCFDISLGTELLAMQPSPVSEHARRFDSKSTSSIVWDAVSHGLLQQSGDFFKVPEHTAIPMRQALRENNKGIYIEVLVRFLQHAEGRLQGPLQKLFGPDGLAVLRETIRVLASENEASAIRNLDELVQERERRGRLSDLDAASRIVQAYGDTSGRLSNYLRGMSLWHRGQREEAAHNFELVLASHAEDRMAGVSGHLRGVYLHSVGKTADALELLTTAVKVLRSQDDLYGAALTTATQARVVLDRFRSFRAHEDLETVDLLINETFEDLENLERNYAGDVSRIQIAIDLVSANVLIEKGLDLDAIKAADRVKSTAPSGSLDSLRAAEIIARAMRNAKLSEKDAALQLRTSLDAFEPKSREERRHQAIAYNILASTLKSSDAAEALSVAQRSLQLGELLKDNRHIAHSLTTYAQIVLSSRVSTESPGATSDELRSLKGQLFRAREILISLNDHDGLRRVRELITEVDELQLRDG